MYSPILRFSVSLLYLEKEVGVCPKFYLSLLPDNMLSTTDYFFENELTLFDDELYEGLNALFSRPFYLFTSDNGMYPYPLFSVPF